jgi:hypothetical protein
MSYDIDLLPAKERCDECGSRYPRPELPDPTYNLTPIFDFVLTGERLPNPAVSEMEAVLFRTKTDRPRGLRLLSGKRADETIPLLEAALVRAEAPEHRDTLTSLEPSNGWGDLPGAVRVLRKLLDAAREFPAHTWRVQ